MSAVSNLGSLIQGKAGQFEVYQSTNSLNNFALVEWIQAIWGSKSLTNFVLRSKCEWGVGRSDLKVQSDESEEVHLLLLRHNGS